MVACGATCTATAAIDLSASATVGVEHDSNPLELGGGELPPSSGSSSRADLSTHLTAHVAAATKGKGPLQAQAQAVFTRANFDNRDSLNHSDYGLSASVDWKPSPVFDVGVKASQTRLPVGLADIGGDQSTQQTSRSADGTLRIRPTPRWQIGLTPAWQKIEQPLPSAPEFELRETSGSVSLDFLGAGRMVPGVLVRKSHGRYSGIENATEYDDRTIQAALNYKVTDFSTFSLYAGHTQRSTELLQPSTDPAALANEGDRPEFTGSLLYQRRLSVKTSISVGAFRSFQRYDAGVNTTVGTGFTGGVTWAMTSKLSLGLSTQYAWSTVNGLRIGGPVSERKDLDRTYSAEVGYKASHRLALRAYGARRMRDSTARSVLFTGTTVGLELTASVD